MVTFTSLRSTASSPIGARWLTSYVPLFVLRSTTLEA
jgi:hypothetical protein